MENALKDVLRFALVFGVPMAFLTVLALWAHAVYERSERKLLNKPQEKDGDEETKKD